jgi:hypothetical protein
MPVDISRFVFGQRTIAIGRFLLLPYLKMT